MKFAFENLKVYQAAIDFNTHINKILDSKPSAISWSMKDQLQRASLSIPLNIAEGNGRWHKAEKRQFFWIARGSTFECVAIIEVMLRNHTISTETKTVLYEDLSEISKMLSGLIKSLEAAGPKGC